MATDPPYGVGVDHSWRDGVRQPSRWDYRTATSATASSIACRVASSSSEQPGRKDGVLRDAKVLAGLAIHAGLQRVGFANSGGLVFVDESAEEITAA
jgi:hypothetical protein